MHAKGHEVHTAKLTAEKVLEIRRSVYAGERSQSEWARELLMHTSTISDLVRGRSWKHLPFEAHASFRKFKGQNNPGARYTEKQVLGLLTDWYSHRFKQSTLAVKWKIPLGTVNKIVLRQLWGHLSIHAQYRPYRKKKCYQPCVDLPSEEWRQWAVNGQLTAYWVSSLGRWKRRGPSGWYLLQGSHARGRHFVGICVAGRSITTRTARAVALMFVANPDPQRKIEVNHKNGDRRDNRAINLEWVTPQENSDHARRNDLFASRGSKNRSAKLDEDKVRMIRQLKPKLSVTKLAQTFGVSRTVIKGIVARRMWAHVV